MLGGMLLVAGHAGRRARRRVRDRDARSACSRSGSSRTAARAFFAFLNPWDDAQGAGFQIVQAMIGMGSGGLFGVGLGQGVAEDLLPPRGAHGHDASRSSARSSASSASTAVIAAFALFAYAGLRIALGCRDPFGKRLAAGLTVLVCGQAAVNSPP